MPSAQIAATWDNHYASASGYRFWPCEELVRSAASWRSGRVLEVGCGNGANLWFLASRHEVVGLDVSARALDAAREHMELRELRRRYSDHVEDDVALVRATADSLPFADASFDAVVDAMTSQHLQWAAHAPLYAEYRRVLRPGGHVFLYHLTNRTSGASGRRDHDRLDLFPAAGFTCLPSWMDLAVSLDEAGFRAEGRGLLREYTDGRRAHYAVIEGTAR